MSIELCGLFLCSRMHCGPEDIPLLRGDPMEVADLLWDLGKPLQSEEAVRFLKTAAYDPAGEDVFDRALEAVAWNPEIGLSNGNNAGATVWHERFTQSIIVLTANARAGEQVIIPPPELGRDTRVLAAALLWWHRMELPFHPGTTLPR